MILSFGTLLIAALTALAVRDRWVVSVAGFAAVVAIIYLVRLSRGAFDPIGSTSLLVWTSVNAVPSAEPLVSGICAIAIAYGLVRSVSRSRAERQYAQFMAQANPAD